MTLSTETIWNQFHEQLRGFFRKRVGDEHIVADLLQETFFRVHRSLDTLEDSDRVLAWVFRIARNVLTDQYRRSARTNTESLGDLDPAENPDSNENHNERIANWLQGMIPALPENYRDALQLAEVEELTQREVAERLGISVSGAKSRVQRGRAQLRQMLLECCHLQFDKQGNIVDCTQHGTCSVCQE